MNKKRLNPNLNLAFFGQRYGGRGHGLNRGRNQGFSFNSKGHEFSPTNQTSTQCGRGTTCGTNQPYTHFSNNNIFSRSVQQKDQSPQSDFSRPNQQQSH